MSSQASAKVDVSVLPSSYLSSQFQRDLVALIPQLRAFSRTLCRQGEIAEDMAQDALAKAWHARARFEPGTNMKAWLFTILRNAVCSHKRRAWREERWDTEKGERIAAPANEQQWAMELSDTARALHRLPEHQREALVLVAAGGFTYEQAARICGAPTGTVKSRAARGRVALLKALDGGRPIPRASSARAVDALSDIQVQLTTFMQTREYPAAARA